jgi:hypothetical protein
LIIFTSFDLFNLFFLSLSLSLSLSTMPTVYIKKRTRTKPTLSSNNLLQRRVYLDADDAYAALVNAIAKTILHLATTIAHPLNPNVEHVRHALALLDHRHAAAYAPPDDAHAAALHPGLCEVRAEPPRLER